MKTLRFFVILFLSFSVFSYFGCGPSKYIPKPNEEVFGTWINEKIASQVIVFFSIGFKEYFHVSDSAPFREGTIQIDSKWKDSEGNIFYKIFGNFTLGSEVGNKYQCLAKISKSGTILEFIIRPAVEFDPKYYPPKIDAQDIYYRVYSRKAS